MFPFTRVAAMFTLRNFLIGHQGISGEKMEIDPVGRKGSARLFCQRAVTYDADSIADCEVIEEKNTVISVFHLTYWRGYEYKHHDFEANMEMCNEIVHTINNILELRPSPVRKDLVTNHKRKLLRKRESLNHHINLFRRCQ